MRIRNRWIHPFSISSIVWYTQIHATQPHMSLDFIMLNKNNFGAYEVLYIRLPLTTRCVLADTALNALFHSFSLFIYVIFSMEQRLFQFTCHALLMLPPLLFLLGELSKNKIRSFSLYIHIVFILIGEKSLAILDLLDLYSSRCSSSFKILAMLISTNKERERKKEHIDIHLAMKI